MRQLERIKQKLALLQETSRVPSSFRAHDGSRFFHPPLDDDQLQAFEHHHQVRLPPGYRDFLQEIGNGGLGPYYGILPLESSLRPWTLEADPLFLARPFPLTRDLYLLEPDPVSGLTVDEDYGLAASELPAEYYTQGTLDICHFGCKIMFLLVVTGAECGSVWVDDRAHDKGIFALTSDVKTGARVDILMWYENWLDALLGEPNEAEEYYGYFEYGLAHG